MRYRVKTQEPTHSGEIGRVMIHNGTAEFDGAIYAAELRYMRSAGHTVEPLDEEAQAYDALQAEIVQRETERIQAEVEAEATANPQTRIAALEAQVAALIEAQEVAATTKTSARKGASSTDGGAS